MPHTDDDMYEAMLFEYVEPHHIAQYSLLPPDRVAALYLDDSYEALVLELVQEEHIVEYGLLPLTPTAPIYIRGGVGEQYTSPGSFATASTQIITIEDASDLPVIHPYTLVTEKEMEAIIAAHQPIPPPDYEADDYDWTVALSTYDYLEIEANKHATARVDVPWKELDYLQEVLEEMEAFAAWEDRRRAMEQDNAPVAAVAEEIQEVCLPRRLFEDNGCMPGPTKETGPLDGILEDVQSLCGTMAN